MESWALWQKTLFAQGVVGFSLYLASSWQILRSHPALGQLSRENKEIKGGWKAGLLDGYQSFYFTCDSREKVNSFFIWTSSPACPVRHTLCACLSSEVQFHCHTVTLGYFFLQLSTKAHIWFILSESHQDGCVVLSPSCALHCAATNRDEHLVLGARLEQKYHQKIPVLHSRVWSRSWGLSSPRQSCNDNWQWLAPLLETWHCLQAPNASLGDFFVVLWPSRLSLGVVGIQEGEDFSAVTVVFFSFSSCLCHDWYPQNLLRLL